MKRHTTPTLLAAASLMLSACASPPLHYYTLSAADHGRVAPTTAPFLLEVLPVDIPAQVDQPQLVVRQDDGTVAVLDSDRWAAPLQDELRDALAAALSQQLGTQEVSGLVPPTGKPVLRVKLEVRRFESRPGQYALIEADWSLNWTRGAADNRLLCHSRQRTSVAADYASLVRGHQQVIVALATQIAETARHWNNAGQAATCVANPD